MRVPLQLHPFMQVTNHALQTVLHGGSAHVDRRQQGNQTTPFMQVTNHALQTVMPD
jgi:hypothetical protein